MSEDDPAEIFGGFAAMMDEEEASEEVATVMTLQQAALLVREAFMEEQRGTGAGPKAEEYRRAVAMYPVTMATALHVWGQEAAKGGR